MLGDGEPTPETLANAIKRFYGDKADDILKAYAATTTDEVYEAAAHLASARFVWLQHVEVERTSDEDRRQTGYRYLYARPRPAYLGMPGQPAPTGGRGGARAAGRPSRRVAFRRDPVRHGQPRSGQALYLGACRLRSLQNDAGVTL